MRNNWAGIVLPILLLAILQSVTNAQQAWPYVVYYSYPTCPVAYAPAPVAQAPAAGCCPASCCSPCCCCQRPDDPGGGSAGGSEKNPDDGGQKGEPDETNGGSRPVQSRRTSASFALSRTVSAKFNTPIIIPITGAWHSKFGTIDLSQSGKGLTGFIRYKHGGIIDVRGRYEFGMLTFIYQHRAQPDVRGTVALHYDSVIGHFAGESKNTTTGRETNWILSR
jgi:hypothetical protein